jgi:predicted signal transduction protein with EAL and GGDEF domain
VAHFGVDGEDGATLVQKAEAALKHAKETGEPYLHYKLEMRSEIAERLAPEHKLREAIDEGQFELYYQPQVSIVTGQIESLEALLRWNDPEQGVR